MRIMWEVDDGYVGKDRPQHTDIPDDELEECETESEKLALIHDYVSQDFDQKITWNITSDMSD